MIWNWQQPKSTVKSRYLFGDTGENHVTPIRTVGFRVRFWAQSFPGSERGITTTWWQSSLNVADVSEMLNASISTTMWLTHTEPSDSCQYYVKIQYAFHSTESLYPRLEVSALLKNNCHLLCTYKKHNNIQCGQIPVTTNVKAHGAHSIQEG